MQRVPRFWHDSLAELEHQVSKDPFPTVALALLVGLLLVAVVSLP